MKNKEIEILTILFSIFIILFFIGQLRMLKLRRQGVYVIATTYKNVTSKRGTHVYATFIYNNTKYEVIFNPGYEFDVNVGRNYFIKILPSNPNIYDFTDIDVPECILKSNEKVWKEIPACDTFP